MKSHYGTTVAGILSLWFVAAVAAAANHVFEGRPGQPPLALLAFATLPILLMVGWYAFSAGFRSFVLSLDPRTLTFLQGWRIAGLSFVALVTFNILPNAFGLSAGYGDIFIGLTAPFVALKLTAPSSRNWFMLWQLLGIVDLVTAVSLGVASRAGHPSTFAMTVLPLSVIPTFAVPIALLLHLVSIRQARAWNASTELQARTRVQASAA